VVSSNTSTARSGPALTPRRYTYERRRPEQTPLYAVVRDHLETFYAAVEDGFVFAPLPEFVRAELERYLDCGILCFSCHGEVAAPPRVLQQALVSPTRPDPGCRPRREPAYTNRRG
jgi:hypothetical protein